MSPASPTPGPPHALPAKYPDGWPCEVLFLVQTEGDGGPPTGLSAPHADADRVPASEPSPWRRRPTTAQELPFPGGHGLHQNGAVERSHSALAHFYGEPEHAPSMSSSWT